MLHYVIIMLLICLVMVLLPLIRNNSLALSVTNQTINAIANYSLTVVRDGSAPSATILVNWGPGISLSGASAVSISGVPSAYANITATTISITIPPVSTSATNLLVVITNVTNPSYNLALNSTNTWVQF